MDYFTGRFPSVVERFQELSPEDLAISAIAAAELRFGADKSTRTAENHQRLGRFLEDVPTLDFDASAAKRYGELRSELERAGTPIGPNDMLIAAQALSAGLAVAGELQEGHCQRLTVPLHRMCACRRWRSAPADFFSRYRRIDQFEESELQPTGYDGYVVHCFEAAAWCCLQGSSPCDILVRAVDLGGETDTIAAVAGGLAGAHSGRVADFGDLQHEPAIRGVARALGALRHRLVYETPGLLSMAWFEVEEGVHAGRNPLTPEDIALHRSGDAPTFEHYLDLHEGSAVAPARARLRLCASSRAAGGGRAMVEAVRSEAPSRAPVCGCWLPRRSSSECLCSMVGEALLGQCW